MYLPPCHNSLDPTTSIIGFNTRKCADIHAPVEEIKQAFDYLGIYYWNQISQKVKINTSKSCKSVYPK